MLVTSYSMVVTRNNVVLFRILIVLLGTEDSGPLASDLPAPGDPGLLSPVSPVQGPGSVPESPGSASIVSSENSRSPYASLATTFTGMSGHHTCPHTINMCPLILITRPCLFTNHLLTYS